MTSIQNLGGACFAVFGGEDSPRHAFDEKVHLCDVHGPVALNGSAPYYSARWREVEGSHPTLGTKALPAPSPAPLLGHASASIGSVLYTFGGRTGGTTCFDQAGEQVSETETATLLFVDTAVLSAQGDRWQTVGAGRNGPAARSFHSMTSLGSRLFVFGGCGERGRLNDLWCIDTAASSPAWVCLSPGGEQGDCPAARGGSSLAAFPETDSTPARLLLLFGFNGEQMGDLWTFELSTGEWVDRTLEQSGEIPSARSVAAATAVSDSELFVFGGEAVPSDEGHEGAGAFTNDAFVLSQQSMEWSSVSRGGTELPARGWAGAATVAAGKVVVWGGLDDSNTRANDGWLCDLGVGV
eukprot:SAG11_NODE_2516_length_3265_cov_3.032533_2_plen_353_part_00